MATLLKYIEGAGLDRTAHLPCRACGSSDALSVAPAKGDTGLVKCFSCGYGATGAQYLAAYFDLSMHEALVRLGAREDHGRFTEEKSLPDNPALTGGGRREAERSARRSEDRVYRGEAIHFGQPPGKGFTALEVEQVKQHMTEEERAEWEAAKEQARGAFRPGSPSGPDAGDRLTALLAKIQSQIQARMHDVDRADTHYDDLTGDASLTQPQKA